MLATFLIRLPQRVFLGAFVFVALVAQCASVQAQGNVALDTIPSQFYYQAVYDIYRGDYRDAQRTLIREAKNSVRIGVTQRWIDAICYHALLGEVYYHQGQPARALEQFNEACVHYLQYPRWMLTIQNWPVPRPDTNLARKILPWGPGTRQFVLGDISSSMLISFGDDMRTQQETLQRGGVFRQQQLWQVDVVEIIRALSVAIRRRNELLGPLAPNDPLTRDLVNKLSGGTAPPQHWSNAWSDLLLGLAYVGQGNLDQAFTRLQRAERVAGQFDHQLTGISLLEQGRLAMEAGKADAADRLFLDASVAAYYYEDAGVIDEAFRLWAMNQLGNPNPQPNPILDAAAAWARGERFDHIYARLCFTRAEEWMIAGDWKKAAATLQDGQSRLQDAATGLLGNWSRYLEARVLAEMGKPAAVDTLNTALAAHFEMSTRFLQLQIANRWFDDQTLRASVAIEIYNQLLSDPSPKDWAFRPLETLAVLKAPLDASYDRWMMALEERKEPALALEVTDLAKRRRYFNQIALGGRVAALRDTFESPERSLSPTARGLRNDMQLRYPQYNALANEGQRLHEQVRRQWQPVMEEAAQRELNRLWDELADNMAARESIVDRLSLSRLPSESQFPPIVPVADMQTLLQPGQALVVFHETADGLIGFLVTESGLKVWDCGATGEISRNLVEFLRDLGNHDRNSTLDEKQLNSSEWQESGRELYQVLFEGSSFDPATTEELIVVPDGAVWYVPLAALPVEKDGTTTALGSATKVRVVPTMGLACGYSVPWRRVQHASIVGGEIVPGKKDEDRTAYLDKLRTAVPNLIEVPSPPPAPAPLVATALEAVVMLDEFDILRDEPFAWSPLPVGREGESDLATWLRLPRSGPQRLVFPGAHTVAENGGKASRRRGNSSPPGSELFLSTCTLISSGAQTILLSRWRVGGQSTLELVREFLQELPRTSGAEAWQRCIEIAKELPLEPAVEPRIKLKDASEIPTASHPFFWAGYLLVDTGEPLVEAPLEADAADEADVKQPPVPLPPQDK